MKSQNARENRLMETAMDKAVKTTISIEHLQETEDELKMTGKTGEKRG